eukprot:TRINITY_DN2437_c0_g1_i1.p1 TRINITY_DN2437_c0_g1~~TRINITY_DN2437_c0_g1_i1.p1  ORF type:complete len:1010 (-),score=304.74 TRINITY_DN2437_c0_g1_i1:205-3210(-)
MSSHKIDNRIRKLISNGIQLGHRSIFVIVGELAHERIVTFHQIMHHLSPAQKAKFLYCCYRKVKFQTNVEKLKKKRKKDSKDNEFRNFIMSQNLRYCKYKDTNKILGQTFDVLILQDFEGLTPNILARTIETVSGGGIIIFLINNMLDLRMLHQLKMDVHKRYQTGMSSDDDIFSRFNFRFLRSLSKNPHCMIVDDHMKVLNVSHNADMFEINEKVPEVSEALLKIFETCQESLGDESAETQIIELSKTAEQARCVLAMMNTLKDTRKMSSTTLSLTAGRGRGKSAALGLSIASAVIFGFSSIVVCAPSSENVQTVFEFIIRALETVGYKEVLDFSIIKQKIKNDLEFTEVITEVEVFKGHRQTIRFVDVASNVSENKFIKTDLLVIDEAAAIPLPIVETLLFSTNLTFMSSTVSGYEGTGRSLSLKLVKELRKLKEKHLVELKLDEPIRYSNDDPVEEWMNKLLCLDVVEVDDDQTISVPPPEDCELLEVNRDTLFSGKSTTELFLKSIWSILVSSHYRNQPDDLQLVADSPTQRLFVLMAPITDDTPNDVLPRILVVIQVVLEGKVSRETFNYYNEQTKRQSGDLIPWVIGTNLNNPAFPQLSGARVIRIATNPLVQGMGYGKQALSCLQKYYNREYINPDLLKQYEDHLSMKLDDSESLRIPKIKGSLPPIFIPLSASNPPLLDWLGVSFGLTEQLYRFWFKSGYRTIYIRQKRTETTGEHTCIMLRPVANQGETSADEFNEQWIKRFSKDFNNRFEELLAYHFNHLTPELSTALLVNNGMFDDDSKNRKLEKEELDELISILDQERIQNFAETNSKQNFDQVFHTIPTLAKLWLHKRLSIKLNPTKMIILVAIAFQKLSVDEISEKVSKQSKLSGLNYEAIKTLIHGIFKKFHEEIHSINEEFIGKDIKKIKKVQLNLNAMKEIEDELNTEEQQEVIVEHKENKKDKKDKKDKRDKDKSKRSKKEKKIDNRLRNAHNIAPGTAAAAVYNKFQREPKF